MSLTTSLTPDNVVVYVAGARSCFVLATVLLWLCIICSKPACTEQSTPAIGRVATAVWASGQSEFCMIALRQAEQRYHLPPALLVSIAQAESGRAIKSLTDVRPWPWTINADGASLFLDSKAAAISWMQERAPEHSFVDVGCMQVNLHYHPDAFSSLEDAFDPTSNADYAARLLVQLYQGEAAGRWDIAVGLYHSHTLQFAGKFRDHVARIGAGVLRGGLLTAGACYLRATYRGPRPTPGADRLMSISMRCFPSIPGHLRLDARRWRPLEFIAPAGSDVKVGSQKPGSKTKEAWPVDQVLRRHPRPAPPHRPYR